MNSFERLYNTINRKPPVNVIAQEQPHSGKNKKPVKYNNHFVQQVNKYRKLKFKTAPENILPSGASNNLVDEVANEKIKKQKEQAKKSVADESEKFVKQRMLNMRNRFIEHDKELQKKAEKEMEEKKKAEQLLLQKAENEKKNKAKKGILKHYPQPKKLFDGNKYIGDTKLLNRFNNFENFVLTKMSNLKSKIGNQVQKYIPKRGVTTRSMAKKQSEAQQQGWIDDNVFYEPPPENKKSQKQNSKNSKKKQKVEAERRNNFQQQTTKSNKPSEHQIINVEEEKNEQPVEKEIQMKFSESSSKDNIPTEFDSFDSNASKYTLAGDNNINADYVPGIKARIQKSANPVEWQQGLEKILGVDHNKAILQDIHKLAKTFKASAILGVIEKTYDTTNNKGIINDYIKFVIKYYKDHNNATEYFPIEYLFDKDKVKYKPQNTYFLRSKSSQSKNKK